MTTNKIVQLQISQLKPGGTATNARKEQTDVEGLAASIATHGQLIPLLIKMDGSEPPYEVVDGNRRLAALKKLQKKNIAEPLVVSCIDVKDGNALELSMIANFDRTELHPVDRFEVFAALVQAGRTVPELAKQYRMKEHEVRQALALGRMAPAVRDAWRDGTMDADTAEAFTITRSHTAQTKALKSLGKQTWGASWNVRRALLNDKGDNLPSIPRMLQIVGNDAYIDAGYEINATLFSNMDEDGHGEVTVSDLPALIALVQAKLEAKCEALVKDGWKWAMVNSAVPPDSYAWKRTGLDHKASKEARANLGCIVYVGHQDDMRIEYGIAKPGDKIQIPKTLSVKKKEAAERAEKKEATGGISNLLAHRLSQQLTAAVREAMVAGIKGEDAEALAVALLASTSNATPHLTVGKHTYENNPRSANSFDKYLKLARGKSIAEKRNLLLQWLSHAIDLTQHDATGFARLLHPDKGMQSDARTLINLIDAKAFHAATLKHFDAEDYFTSINKQMLVEHVREALGEEHATRVAKMKSADAATYAAKHVKNWIPPALRK